MVEKTATIHNGHGIHCRPSAVIIKTAVPYAGQIEVLTDSGRTTLRSLLELVALDLQEGAVVRIRVSGPGEEEFCSRLVGLFETHFDFPPVSAAERKRSLADLLAGA